MAGIDLLFVVIAVDVFSFPFCFEDCVVLSNDVEFLVVSRFLLLFSLRSLSTSCFTLIWSSIVSFVSSSNDGSEMMGSSLALLAKLDFRELRGEFK